MKGQKKIVPHLWFDKEAKEAAEFYSQVFPRSRINQITTLHDTPSGDAEIISFELMEAPFMAISAGPYFKFNPAVSFMVNFDPSQDQAAATAIDSCWNKLAAGGKVLMPLQEYPWSKRYGWVEDKYGLSWQLILTDPAGEERPQMIPSLLFVDDNCGRAEEAVNFYLSIFKDSKRGEIVKYPAGSEPNHEGSVMFADFKLFDTWFAAMDSAEQHGFNFNEAASFIVNCDDQAEIDYYWEKLSAVPEAEQCGWLKDKYGLSWQIVPRSMDEMMNEGTPEQIDRLTKAFLPMKKFNLAELEAAYKGAG